MAVTPSTSSPAPGKKVQFEIRIWTNVSGMTATIKASVAAAKDGTAFTQPVFMSPCQSPASCTVPTVPRTQKEPYTPQAEAQLTVPASAPAGDKVTVTFTYTATYGATKVQKWGKQPVLVTVTKPPSSPSPSPTPTGHSSPGASNGGGHSSGTKSHGGSSTSAHSSHSTPGTTVPGTSGSEFSLAGGTQNTGTAVNGLGAQLPIGPLPTVPGSVTSISPPGNAGNLFPKISPSSIPNPAPGTPPVAARGRQATTTGDSSPIPPLGSAEFGAQVLGLVLLALGVVIAITRLSLRRSRAGGSPSSQ